MVTLFSKREAVDLSTLAVRERDDVRAAEVSEVTTLSAYTAARAAREGCQRETEKADEGATSPPRHRDPLRMQEAADRMPELFREERRLERDYQRAVLHGEAIKKAACAEGRAAMLPGFKHRIEEMFTALDEAREKSRAVLTYVNEMARKLDLPSTGYEEYAFADWFVGDAHRESGLEFRRRLAREAGLL